MEKKARGRPVGSYSLKILPDGSQKRMNIFEYKKELSKARAKNRLLKLGEPKIKKVSGEKQITIIINL